MMVLKRVNDFELEPEGDELELPFMPEFQEEVEIDNELDEDLEIGTENDEVIEFGEDEEFFPRIENQPPSPPVKAVVRGQHVSELKAFMARVGRPVGNSRIVIIRIGD